MTVGEFINKARMEQKIEFRDEDGRTICQAESTSAGINPYVDYEILEWFTPTRPPIHSLIGIDIVLYIKKIEYFKYLGEPNHDNNRID